jgi:radical SAM superfamily enzyme YgiQ (UPF0313 family)
MEIVMAKMGRPTLYTEELANEILEAIKNSPRGIAYLSKQNPHWPNRSNIVQWISEKEDFRALYAEAKQIQADYMAEEMIDVSYDDKKDYKVIVDGEGNERIVLVAEAINRSRLKVDTLKHVAALLAPKKWGTKPQDNKDIEKSLVEKLIDKL